MTTKAPKVLGREALGRRNFKRKEVPIEEWDGVVLIRRLSEREVVEIQDTARKAVKRATGKNAAQNGADPDIDTAYVSRFRRMLVWKCWINQDGSQVLEDVNDLELLADEEFAVIEKIADVAAEHNGMKPDAEAGAEKNSDAILNGASGSG